MKWTMLLWAAFYGYQYLFNGEQTYHIVIANIFIVGMGICHEISKLNRRCE